LVTDGHQLEWITDEPIVIGPAEDTVSGLIKLATWYISIQKVNSEYK